MIRTRCKPRQALQLRYEARSIAERSDPGPRCRPPPRRGTARRRIDPSWRHGARLCPAWWRFTRNRGWFRFRLRRPGRRRLVLRLGFLVGISFGLGGHQGQADWRVRGGGRLRSLRLRWTGLLLGNYGLAGSQPRLCLVQSPDDHNDDRGTGRDDRSQSYEGEKSAPQPRNGEGYKDDGNTDCDLEHGS